MCETAETHVYGEHVITTDGTLRSWVRQCNDGRTNICDETPSEQPSVINDGLLKKWMRTFLKLGVHSRILCGYSKHFKVLHEIVRNCLIMENCVPVGLWKWTVSGLTSGFKILNDH